LAGWHRDLCQGKQSDRGVQVCEIRSLACNPLFEVVNVAADFSALKAKGGDDMLFGHMWTAPKAGDGWLEILAAAAPRICSFRQVQFQNVLLFRASGDSRPWDA
jgi:hypothetical protein